MYLRLTIATLLLIPSFFASPPAQGRAAIAVLTPALARAPVAAGASAEARTAVAGSRADMRTARADAGAVRGIDVSHYQGRIDWTAVEGEGIAFAFVKASEGATFVDPAFARNWTALGGTRIARGAYHRFRPRVDAVAQARHFLAVAPVTDGGLPPVLDVESVEGVSDARLVSGVRAWLAEVERATGRRPIVYTKPRFRREHLGRALDDYPLWTAEYGVDAPSIDRWALWQHSEHGRIAGIAKEVDLDRLNVASDLALALTSGTTLAAR
jgi:lysozyme